MAEPKRIGKYDIIEEIGRGGFAVVYRARDANMGRDVALKVITGDAAENPSFVERFKQEVRVAANLRHPNIVPVYDFGDDDGSLYLAMPFIGEGRTLRDLLAERERLSLDEATSLLASLAGGLDYLHSQEPSLVHRDVKPANVLLEGQPPQVVLADFGLVRLMEASAELTQTGSILGTAAYMAPEQAAPERWGEITPATDVYALGVIAYEMLVGQPPFEGELPSVIHAQAYEPPPLPLDLVSGLSDDVATILTQALAKPPGERYPSAGALVEALQEIARARVAAAEQETTLEHLMTEAQGLIEAEEWLEALDCCTQIIRLDPDHPAALKMLSTAKQGLDRERAEAVERRRLKEKYEEGMEWLEEKGWQQAIAAFEEVVAGNPDFRDVEAHLARAREELQLGKWHNEAIAHSEASEWVAACRTWIEILERRLGYRDLEAAARFVEASKQLLAQYDQARRAQEALRLYDGLAGAAQAQDWETVAEEGERLLQLAPDLEHPQVWISGARQRVERAVLAEDVPEGDRRIWEKDGKEMVRIPAGEFLYGDDKEPRELPEFWIDRTLVTNAEYARFVAETGQKPPKHWKGQEPPEKIADHPVVYVSWYDAVAYAEWAGKRLPTEEEWEKAARGTDGREYPWGDEEPTPELCNFDENMGGTTPVGKYSPRGDSPYGCVDMAGNVWEWTASKYGDAERRVLRGGSFDFDTGRVRCAYRFSRFPSARLRNFGFRVVASP